MSKGLAKSSESHNPRFTLSPAIFGSVVFPTYDVPFRVLASSGFLCRYLIFLQIYELASMKQPKNLFQLKIIVNVPK